MHHDHPSEHVHDHAFLGDAHDAHEKRIHEELVHVTVEVHRCNGSHERLLAA